MFAYDTFTGFLVGMGNEYVGNGKVGHIYNVCEPVSVKTGLNDIEMKIKITALPESINFSECFLKI